MENIDLKFHHSITIEHAKKYKINGFEPGDVTQQFKLDDETALYKYSDDNYLMVNHNGYDFTFRSNKKFILTLGQINDVAVLEWV